MLLGASTNSHAPTCRVSACCFAFAKPSITRLIAAICARVLLHAVSTWHNSFRVDLDMLAGKTLALLCATLAWQQQQAHAATHKPDGTVPRIFWAARTHAQIDHAVHEVRWVTNSCRTSGLALVMVIHGRWLKHCLHLVLVGAFSNTVVAYYPIEADIYFFHSFECGSAATLHADPAVAAAEVSLIAPFPPEPCANGASHCHVSEAADPTLL